MKSHRWHIIVYSMCAAGNVLFWRRRKNLYPCQKEALNSFSHVSPTTRGEMVGGPHRKEWFCCLFFESNLLDPNLVTNLSPWIHRECRLFHICWLKEADPSSSPPLFSFWNENKSWVYLYFHRHFQESPRQKFSLTFLNFSPCLLYEVE